MENDIDLCFAILAKDPFGFGLPERWASALPEWDVPLGQVQDAIRSFYFIDS